jgi:hypothetical protein
MAANVSLVRCPELVCAGCGGEAVAATYRETTVEVAACTPLQAQGWGEGPAVVLWHSQALELLVPAATRPAVQHRDGLVVFA